MDEEEEYKYPNEKFTMSRKEFAQRFIKRIKELKENYPPSSSFPQESPENKLWQDRCAYLRQVGVWPPEEWRCPENLLLTGVKNDST